MACARRLVLALGLAASAGAFAPALGPVGGVHRGRHRAGRAAGADVALLPGSRFRRAALLRRAATGGPGEHDIFEPLREVEAGCVLVASEDEMDHFSRHGVVLVLSHGAQGSRGVLLEMATAFTVGEMAAALDNTPFSDLPLFRGGSGGQDKVLMLHDVADLARSQPVGSHGIHVGGLQSASDAVSQGLLPAERFKFFFNQMEWVPGALEREVSQGIWTPGVIPPALVLRQIGSQSERPLAIERKLGQVTNVEVGKALWDLLHELLPSTASLETLLIRTPPLTPPAPLRDHPPALALDEVPGQALANGDYHRLQRLGKGLPPRTLKLHRRSWVK